MNLFFQKYKEDIRVIRNKLRRPRREELIVSEDAEKQKIVVFLKFLVTLLLVTSYNTFTKIFFTIV